MRNRLKQLPSSTFKKALGISPNDYRKNILGYGGEKLEKAK